MITILAESCTNYVLLPSEMDFYCYVMFVIGCGSEFNEKRAMLTLETLEFLFPDSTLWYISLYVQNNRQQASNLRLL